MSRHVEEDELLYIPWNGTIDLYYHGGISSGLRCHAAFLYPPERENARALNVQLMQS